MILNRKENQPKKSAQLNISDSKMFEAIRKRAYELYCSRGYKHGNDLNDWVQAEKEIRKEMNLSQK